jgi:3-phosphoshikimate 1-carboxyvinyltransferase
MAIGETRIENFASSIDCASTLECLSRMGVSIERSGDNVTIQGVGKTGFRVPDMALDCGNSGTTMRLLAGVLAGQDFDAVMTGDESLCSRPMRRIAEPLSAMGARVETIDGHPPLKIFGGSTLLGTEHVLPIASAQIKSCIMLAGLNAGGETVVEEPVLTRDHTERMLRKFGVEVRAEPAPPRGRRYSIFGTDDLYACRYTVPGDVSAAAFFVVAASCLAGSNIVLPGVGLNPTRTDSLAVLTRLGARISGDWNLSESIDRTGPDGEPAGELRVKSGFGASGSEGSERANVISGDSIPKLIDEIPILAVLGTQIAGGIEVRDASELRVKESDRIAAVVENLRSMNADIEEFDDGFRVRRSPLRAARISAFGDHRIAMAFAIAGLLADGETEIDGADCAAVSFPAFFEVLHNVAVYE